jgi:hypothetical protein
VKKIRRGGQDQEILDLCQNKKKENNLNQIQEIKIKSQNQRKKNNKKKRNLRSKIKDR